VSTVRSYALLMVVVCKECNANQERARLFARMQPSAAVNEMGDCEQDGVVEPRKEAPAHYAGDLDSQPREADTHTHTPTHPPDGPMPVRSCALAASLQNLGPVGTGAGAAQVQA
jgi:hypothetical protein